MFCRLVGIANVIFYLEICIAVNITTPIPTLESFPIENIWSRGPYDDDWDGCDPDLDFCYEEQI